MAMLASFTKHGAHGHLAAQVADRPDAAVARGDAAVVPAHDLEARRLDALAVEVGELADLPAVEVAVEAAELGVGSDQLVEDRLVIRDLERWKRLGR